jgi:hypothetical protein
VIRQLALQANDEPGVFASAIGAALPGLTRLHSDTDEQFAHAAARYLGNQPTTSERTLWKIWKAAK